MHGNIEKYKNIKGVPVCPRVAWSAVGDPGSVDIQKASVLHEYYSKQRTRSYQDVNRMFYEALIASGVSEVKAKVLYVAVESYMPRWTISK